MPLIAVISGATMGESSAPASGEYDLSAFDPFDIAFISNPYPVLRYARTQAPVFQSKGGNWVVTRHADIVSALSNPLLSNTPSPFAVVSQRNREKHICADVANNSLPFLDAPEHTPPRKLIARTFQEHLKANAVSADSLAQQMFATCRQSGQFDLLHDFATPFTLRFMALFLGVDHSDSTQDTLGKLKEWSDWFFYLFSIIPSRQVRDQLNQELQEFRAFFAEQIRLKSNHPANDLISRLLEQNRLHNAMSDAQIIDNCMLVMTDGINADYGIANAILALVKDPQLLSYLRQHPESVAEAAQELLRYESPSLFVARRALEDIELGGQRIKQNSGVLLMLAAANRDESVFDQPDQLLLNRNRNLYMSFGKGEHACIGRALVVSLLEAAIRQVLDQPDLTVDDARVRWQTRAGHRWLEALPLSC
jgi:pimeloyl-[acyl-carrier protein] synthase